MKKNFLLSLPADGDIIPFAEVCRINNISNQVLNRIIISENITHPHKLGTSLYWLRSELEGLPLFSKEAEYAS